MPFIKKLILHGFKSFAFKTEFHFKDGTICVVGPNGCGKSNVVDALKWVFGEKGSKAFRGENIIDIIFAGTEIHKAMGLAEVEIIIDNSEMNLPLKNNEISVKRRVYRSGEPEYLINKTNVRLKDIWELFADTGVGKGAYSFMEQGKIDRILSSKPEERRSLFEEAAGIARYKMRKKETLSKLDLTSNNLNQVNILLKELENERKSLKNQAEKAKIYNTKKAKLKDLEIQLYGSRYKQNTEKLEKVNTKITTLTDKKVKLKTENSEINSEIEKMKDMIFKFNQTKNDFEKKRLTFKLHIDSNNDKIKYFDELATKNTKEFTLKDNQISEFNSENAKINKLIDKQKNELLKYKLELDENENKLKKISQERKTLQEKKSDNLKEKELLKTEIDSNNTQVDELRIDLRKVTDEFVAQIDIKKKELEGKKDGSADLKTKIEQLIENILSELNSKKAKNNIVEELKKLKKLFNDFNESQDDFSKLIFDEKGPYAKKEKIDQKINSLLDTIISNQNKISSIESENEKFTKQISDLSEKYSELDKARTDLKHHINNCSKDIRTFKENLARNNSYIQNLKSEISNIKDNNSKLKSESQKLKKENETSLANCKEIDKKIAKFEDDMTEHHDTISKRKDKISNLLNKLEDLEKAIENQKETKYKTEELLTNSKDYLYQEFNVKVESIITKLPKGINDSHISSEISGIKVQIKDLGHVNLLAEELYDDVNKRYKFHVDQKEDLLSAKNDLMKIIEEVNIESEKLFITTFNKVRKNFSEVFKQIFGGGKADLTLVDPDNVLESGIEINAQPPGKKVNSYAWLSGGERTLVAIGLMFSIFMVKPSPFCIMDEIDAALDEQNNLKFLKIMKQFSKNTQFIIISHNKQTIANCDYLYGVTMEEKGISKVVSLELKKEKIDDYVK